MKRFLTILTAMFVISSAAVFAQENTGFDRNVLTVEATGAIPGFGVNESATYNYMFTEKFGLGGGIIFTEGLVDDICLYVDFSVAKCHISAGGGYDWGFNAPALYLKAAYYGNNWEWGPGRAGLVIGGDWHFAFINEFKGSDSYEQLGNAIGWVLHCIPRFIIGVNWQLGF